MKSFVVVLLICVVVLSIVGRVECNFTGSVRRGLLVTTARQWVVGIPQQVCITSHHLSAVNVTVTVCQGDNVTNIFNSTRITLPVEGQNDVIANRCVPLTLNVNNTVSNALLLVSARSHGDEVYRFRHNVSIILKRQDVTTFIETDKAIYKPSDTVRIRILSVRGPEIQLVTNLVSLVYVEDPSGTRIAQWSDVETTNGLVQLELPLSSEPPLGIWKIKTTVDDHLESTTFTVKEYVLPKFEVSIIQPAQIYFEEDQVIWRVCARYTYGEPMHGRVAITSICSKRTVQYYPHTAPEPCIAYNNTALSDGCAEFTIDTSRLQLPTEHWRLSNTEITVSASVEERGTGVALDASQTIKVTAEKYKIEFSESNRPFFKPGLDYQGSGSVKLNKDQSPGANIHQIFVDLTRYGKNVKIINQTVTSEANGKFNFAFPADALLPHQNHSLRIRIKVLGAPSHGSEKYWDLKPWYSPSNSYLQIHSPDGTTQVCQSLLIIPFTYISADTSSRGPFPFTYQIVSRGNIVMSDVITSSASSSQMTASITVQSMLNIRINSTMSGSFDLVVFHVRSDGETVGDTAHISVDECFQHQVSMNFAEAKVQPGHVTSVEVTADEMSLCAVGVVDKSVELMGKSTWLTPSRVDDTRKTYHISRQYKDHYSESCRETPLQQAGEIGHREIRRRGPRSYRRHHYHFGSSEFLDTTTAFHFAGIVILTDLTVNTRPCEESLPVLYARGYAGAAESLPQPMLRKSNVRQPAAVPILFDDDNDSVPDARSTPTVQHRTYFPETWLWQLENIGETKQYSMPVTLPHTITEWVGGGYCVNIKSGVGVSKPFKITAFQPFFVSFTLPYSLVRGESVVIPVTVFNYLSDQCLKVTLTVANSTSFELRKVNRKSQLSPQFAQLKVCGRQSETHSFRIVARELGNINFTVMASSEPSSDEELNTVGNIEQATASDAVTQQLLVISEGKKEEYARSAYTCAVSDNAFQSTGNWSLTLPDDVIADSVRTRINVIGDVMGSALSDLDKLLALPTGCGEQNMLKFAPNIYVLEYLSQTEQLTDEIKAKATGFLRTGYQRELTYRHNDGSYSAFGNSDPEGSIWLTAFVVRSFARAQPYIYIDGNDLEASINWIGTQQKENGCFRSVGRVLHKGMTGGLQHDDSQTALTAYIVIALLEANISNTHPSIVNSFRCISQQSVDDVYTLSLISYAYALYGRDVIGRRDIANRLNDKAIRTGGMRYWQSDRTRDHNVDMSSSSANIEMTSYVLLSILHGEESDIHSEAQVIRWLTSQRNAYGGFSSTQDTILALQALSKFATKVFRAARNLDLTVTVNNQGRANTRCQGRRHCRQVQFDVNRSNRLVQQSVNAELRLPTPVYYSISGTGCALVQVAVKYNRQVMPGDQSMDIFLLDVDVEQKQSSSCKIMNLNICARYNGEDTASNMAVVAVNMVSGWIPDKDSVRKLKNDVKSGVKRVDIEKNVVNFYFDEFDSTRRCFSFEVLQDIVVTNTKPGLVHIYDYYTPGTSVFTNYDLSTTNCTTHRSAAISVELTTPGGRNRQRPPRRGRVV